MEEEKQRRKEDNKEISSCYQVQQQPAGTVIPEIKCESCGSISEEDVRLCRNEKFLVPDPIWSGGKTTNIVYECNVCETTGTILMVPGEGHPLPSSFGETRKHATIMVFDCDGVEPVSFSLDKTPWEALFGIFSEVEFENHVCRYSLCFIADMHLQQVCFISSYEGGEQKSNKVGVEKELQIDASWGLKLVAKALVSDCAAIPFDLISLQRERWGF
ncbi:hypothetical protein AAC387_Pa02g0923 [Persea americana]